MQGVVRRLQPIVRRVHARVRARFGFHATGRARRVPVERAFEKRQRFGEFGHRRAPGRALRVPLRALRDEGEERGRGDPGATPVERVRHLFRGSHTLERGEETLKPGARRVLVQHDVGGVAAASARRAHETRHDAFEIRRGAELRARLTHGVERDAAAQPPRVVSPRSPSRIEAVGRATAAGVDGPDPSRIDPTR